MISIRIVLKKAQSPLHPFLPILVNTNITINITININVFLGRSVYSLQIIPMGVQDIQRVEKYSPEVLIDIVRVEDGIKMIATALAVVVMLSKHT